MNEKVIIALHLILTMALIMNCRGTTIETFLDGEAMLATTGGDGCTPDWQESAVNPLFGRNNEGVDRAYYPFVLKVGSTYHVWYGDGAGTRHATSLSPDFNDIAHPAPQITVSGNPISTIYDWAYHPYVLYNASGWNVNSTSYNEPFLMYLTPSFNSVRAFVSNDGSEWTEVGVCSGITTYGPQGRGQ